jgi:GNAT superfamily N-acetyltransferase
VIEIADHAELRARCAADTLCLWAARGLDGRSRAWRDQAGTAVAVAGAALSTRNRIAVHGATGAAVPLVSAVLDLVGPSYRPLGDSEVVAALIDGIPQLAKAASFGWMDSHGPAPSAGPSQCAEPRWLADDDMADVSALLQAGFPDSDAQPGVAGVERWAGIRDERGRILAAAALAWSAPDVGYLAGVAVHPQARGQGLGRQVCAFVLTGALAEHGAAALMVEEWNDSAIRLYRSLGMGYRAVVAAAVTA